MTNTSRKNWKYVLDPKYNEKVTRVGFYDVVEFDDCTLRVSYDTDNDYYIIIHIDYPDDPGIDENACFVDLKKHFNLPIHDLLEAKAYKVATSNTLVKTLTKEELEALSDDELDELIWSRLGRTFDGIAIREYITSIVEDILTEFTQK